MNINLLSSEPSLSNSKLDNKGVNVLTGDDNAFQKILKGSEKEQLSSAKLAKVDGRVLNYKNKIDAHSGHTLSDKHLPVNGKKLENITTIQSDKISHAAGKDKTDALLDAKIKSDDSLANLKSQKGSSHSADTLAAKSPLSDADLKRSSSLKTQQLSTEESLEQLPSLKSDPKLVSEKTTTSISDASTIEKNPKLIKDMTTSQAKTTDSQLEPKLASTVIENDSTTTVKKSKLNTAETTNPILSDESKSKLKPGSIASSAASKSKVNAVEHDSKLISKLKAKETEKASTEDSDSKLVSTLNAATLTAPVLTTPELTSSNAANSATMTESDPKLVSTSAAMLLTATSEKESEMTTKNFSDQSDPKLRTKSDKNNLEITTKAATKKSEPNLALAADSTSTAATTAPISKSAEMTNAILQTIQSEKQNNDMNLTTTSTNHVVNQVNVPTQQQVSTPPITLPVPVNNPQWQDSLSQQIVVFNRQNIQKAEIRLHPEELGSLQIKLEMNDGKMQLQMASAHAAVRGILESAIPHLRTSLAEQGIDLQQADISNSSASDNANQQSMFSQQQRRGNSAETPLSQQEDLGLIDNNAARGVIKQSGLSVFA